MKNKGKSILIASLMAVMVVSFSGMGNAFASTPADASVVKNQKGCDGKNDNFTTLLTFPDSDTFDYNVIHETDISKSMVLWCDTSHSQKSL